MRPSTGTSRGGGRQPAAERLLCFVLAFGAVSAVIGAFMALALGGAGFPIELLEGTPFTSAFWPGLILGVVVGGTQGIAAAAAARHSSFTPLLSSVAGFGMLIWIFVEVAMLDGFDPLQGAYFALGLVEVALTLTLLTVWSPMVERFTSRASSVS